VGPISPGGPLTTSQKSTSPTKNEELCSMLLAALLFPARGYPHFYLKIKNLITLQKTYKKIGDDGIN